MRWYSAKEKPSAATNQKASSDLAKEKKKGQILEAEVETPASAGTALVSRDCCE